MPAAVPRYVGNDFNHCPPGHRFGLYFPVWKDDWSINKEGKKAALEPTLNLPPESVSQLDALRRRQVILLDAHPEAARLSIEAKTIAPFATGLGLEHPLENGFAFLNPYGLPYLPGSGVKGVLRRAAEELAGELIESDHKGWTEAAITALFGLESEDYQKEHQRGALTFWDAIPKPARNRLGIEVMTPHYGGYYLGVTTPHDASQPNPIVFLVVPEGSEFSFHLTCDLARLPTELADTWRDLMRAAFEHAFDWLGFGAKTAVGYGAMRRDAEAERRAAQARAEREAEARRQQEAAEEEARRQAELARLDPVERDIRLFLDARPNKNQSEISAVIGAVKQGLWQGEQKIAVARWLEQKMRATKGEWKESSQAKKPEKDREYQNTLLVKGWLEGK